MSSNLGFSGSYAAQDVTFLLKPIQFQTTEIGDKETHIQSGAHHYSTMLSPEHPPSEVYMELYQRALAANGQRLANDISALAATLDATHPVGKEIVLVSLVRAGTPIGVLLARALVRLGRKAFHYSVSIIRDRGIDQVALGYITARHDASAVVFVDGWTGKGAIATELRSCLKDVMDPFLVVVADPAGQANLAATHDDYLIASGLLNGVVSGLVSRSILRDDVVGPQDFHACVELTHLAPFDVSRAFISEIDALAGPANPIIIDPLHRDAARQSCANMVDAIMADAGVTNRNLIKPGIAEATRALLRRLPHALYIKHEGDPDVQHLLYLATSNAVPILPLNSDGHFKAVAVIKTLETN